MNNLRSVRFQDVRLGVLCRTVLTSSHSNIVAGWEWEGNRKKQISRTNDGVAMSDPVSDVMCDVTA